MLNKEHNTLEGIQKIVNIRASLNKGLPSNLKEAFPMTIPATLYVERFIKNNNLHPEWVAGFSTGESNFFIALKNLKLRVVYILHYVFQLLNIQEISYY